MVDVGHVLRGGRVENMHLLAKARVQRILIVIPNLLGHPLPFVERLGLTDAATHAGLHLSRDSLVRPESFLSQGRI